jgi:putative RNA 2'-phosphotransferase
MGRQYVHLSTTLDMALEVGRRKDPRPVIVTVDAGSAADAGITFFAGNDRVWLADAVPPGFLRYPKEPARPTGADPGHIAP